MYNGGNGWELAGAGTLNWWHFASCSRLSAPRWWCCHDPRGRKRKDVGRGPARGWGVDINWDKFEIKQVGASYTLFGSGGGAAMRVNKTIGCWVVLQKNPLGNNCTSTVTLLHNVQRWHSGCTILRMWICHAPVSSPSWPFALCSLHRAEFRVRR